MSVLTTVVSPAASEQSTSDKEKSPPDPVSLKPGETLSYIDQQWSYWAWKNPKHIYKSMRNETNLNEKPASGLFDRTRIIWLTGFLCIINMIKNYKN